jgi:hypothetical protein
MMFMWIRSVVNALFPPLLLTQRVTLLYIVSLCARGGVSAVRVHTGKHLPSFRRRSAHNVGRFLLA